MRLVLVKFIKLGNVFVALFLTDKTEVVAQ